ncbi:MAG: hypothetical protein HYW48_09270 [Deltaproteobacteria bacterium]|nr:hypothetical protein [Deltaproteobacteria bacterium]
MIVISCQYFKDRRPLHLYWILNPCDPLQQFRTTIHFHKEGTRHFQSSAFPPYYNPSSSFWGNPFLLCGLLNSYHRVANAIGNIGGIQRCGIGICPGPDLFDPRIVTKAHSLRLVRGFLLPGLRPLLHSVLVSEHLRTEVVGSADGAIMSLIEALF